MSPNPTRACPNGHSVADQNADYCTTCGNALKARCPNGHLVDPTSDYCDRCGAPLAAARPVPATAATIDKERALQVSTGERPAPPVVAAAADTGTASSIPEQGRRRGRRSKKPLIIGAGIAVLAALAAATIALTGNDDSTDASSSSASTSTAATNVPTTADAPTTTTTGAVGATSRQMPVVNCPTTFGTTNHPTLAIPSTVTVNLTAGDAAQLAAYSNGKMTVLAPTGWSCNATYYADGTRIVRVTPPGQNPDPTLDRLGIALQIDYAAHNPGAGLACGLFPDSRAATNYQQSLGCPSYPDQTVTHPAPDVARFSDPPNTPGSAEYAGGDAPSEGALVYRLAAPFESTNLAKISCTLDNTTLCRPIIDDFLARGYPTGQA